MEQSNNSKMITNEDFKAGGKPVRAEVEGNNTEPGLRMKNSFYFPQVGVTIEAENLTAATEKLNETYKSNN